MSIAKKYSVHDQGVMLSIADLLFTFVKSQSLRCIHAYLRNIKHALLGLGRSLVWRLYLSVRNVTKHGDWSPSLTGINWVSDRVSIDLTEYMHRRGVRFFGSLEQTIIVDFWERNRAIPVGTKLLLLSNRLQGFWWDRTILNWSFSIHAAVSTYTSVSITWGSGIFWRIKN